MQEIYRFLSENSVLLDYLVCIIYVVFSVLLFKKSGDIKYLKEVCENIMKYRTEHYVEDPVQVEQNGKVDLSSTVTKYRLNKSTNMLEEDGVMDINELVQSHDIQTLKRIYERFFPQTEQNVVVEELNYLQDDLDKMQEAFAVAEQYRTKYGLSSDLHFSEIISKLSNKEKELSERIELAQKIREDIKNEEEKN